MNVNVERALAKHGIPDWSDIDENDTVPLVHFIKSLEAGAEATGDAEFSMRVAKEHELDSFAGFGKAIQSGVTVYDAMKIACRLVPNVAPTLKWWIQRRKNGVLLCRKQSVTSPDLEQALSHLERYTMLLFVNIVRSGANPNWSPPMVCVSAQTNSVFGRWADFDDTSVEFEAPFSAIYVPDKILVLPLRDRAAPVAEVNANIDEQLVSHQLGKDIVQDVRMLTQSLLRHKSAKLPILSEVTMMSKRTLQRRLAENGHTFQTILHQARFNTAVQALCSEDASVAETSELLGYEHPHHFIRAFRRWTGMTPGHFKQIRSLKN
jgi:AraC-like DNA-binding protein